MRRMLLLTLGMGINFSACVEAPQVPKIDHTCIVDKSLPGGACSKGKGQKFTMTMEQLDGHYCVSLSDAKAINNFIIEQQKTILELQKK